MFDFAALILGFIIFFGWAFMFLLKILPYVIFAFFIMVLLGVILGLGKGVKKNEVHGE